MTYRTAPKAYCPACNEPIGAADGVNEANSERPPEDGDVAICFYCHHIGIYTADLQVRNPNDEEIIEMAGNPDIVEAINSLGRFKEWEKKKNAR